MKQLDPQKPKLFARIKQGVSEPVLTKASDILDFMSKLGGIIALVVGSWWTYNNFTLHREGAEMLDVKLDPQVVAADTDHPLIIANVTLHNIGKVGVLALKHNIKDKGLATQSINNCSGEKLKGFFTEHEGLELVVIEYSNPKEGISNPRKDPRHKDQYDVIDWDEGGGSPSRNQWPVREYNMLKDHTAFKNCNYFLNPGSTTREAVAIPAKIDTLYALRVRFWSDNSWSEKDIAFVHVDRAKTSAN